MNTSRSRPVATQRVELNAAPVPLSQEEVDLLFRAAEAGGFQAEIPYALPHICYRRTPHGKTIWNSLCRDQDAMDLLVTLGMSLNIERTETTTLVAVLYEGYQLAVYRVENALAAPIVRLCITEAAGKLPAHLERLRAQR